MLRMKLECEAVLLGEVAPMPLAGTDGQID